MSVEYGFHGPWEQRAGRADVSAKAFWTGRKDAPYHNAFIALL